MQIEIKEETLKFLKDLVHEINMQDRMGTASPYFFVIKEPKWKPTHPDYHDGETRQVFVYHGDQYENLKGFIKEQIENGYSEKEAEEMAEHLEEITEEKYETEDNVFLTQKGYEEHLKLNGHNLREPFPYIKFASRNPEIKGLFEALSEITGEKLIR